MPHTADMSDCLYIDNYDLREIRSTGYGQAHEHTRPRHVPMLARIGVRLRQFFDDHHHEDLADEVWTVVVRALILCVLLPLALGAL
jgi:hypothetical protein